MEDVITYADINEADTNEANVIEADDFELGSNDEPNKRIEELPEIERTEWFQLIGMCPVNIAELNYFVEQMDLLYIFENMDINTVTNFSSKRLDALYLILRIINSEAVKFCEHVIKTYVMKEINQLFYSHPMISSVNDTLQSSVNSFIEEFYVDLGEFVIRFLTTFNDSISGSKNQTLSKEQLVKNLTDRMIRYCTRLLKSEYYTEIFNDFNIKLDKNYLKSYYVVFKEIVEQIIEYTTSVVNPILTKITTLASEFLNDKITDDEILQHISLNTNIQKLSDSDSDAIDSFTMTMTENLSPHEINKEKVLRLWQYDNFIYTAEHKKESRKHAFWIDDVSYNSTLYDPNTNNKNYADEKLTKIGMMTYPEKSTSDILTLFVLHGFAKDSSELVKQIAELMESSQNDPGVFNKYDDIDLKTSFLLTTISNDIDTTYENFVAQIKEKCNLPTKIPTEFILRLISRILNTDIKLYDKSLTCTNIDNKLYDSYLQAPIIIYQHNSVEYYLLHKINEVFTPLVHYQDSLDTTVNTKPAQKKRSTKKKVTVVEI